MDWKIYYTDGETFSSEDGTWEDAPADGIVAVVVADEDYGRYVLNGLNYYYTHNGEVAHTNDIGPSSSATARPGASGKTSSSRPPRTLTSHPHATRCADPLTGRPSGYYYSSTRPRVVPGA